MGTEHLTMEREAGAYAHQLSTAMGHFERAWHEERGLAAVRPGLTTNMIANMGKGKHISMETLLRICKALNCGILNVIELEHDEEAEISN